ncbi:13080_t:CDS:2 [Entrophospora sp. SA101]|nr:13080_t:CDS:2 [Entrophospora sp. SA101]
MLMMRAVVKWIDYNLDETYDIMIAFSDLQLPLRRQIPEEISAVPMKHCKHLSPIHL